VAAIAAFAATQYPGSVVVDELNPPEGLSMPGDFIAVPFADQLVAPPPTPDAGAFVWQRSIVDSAGNVLTDARVEVRHAETLGLAEIYEDRQAVSRKSNPFLVDAEGFARFYALAGLYQITASRAGLERIFENVLLGIRITDIPDLTELVAPIVEDALAGELQDLDDALAQLPDLVRFRVLASGTGQGLPAGHETTRLGVGYYRVTHNRGDTNYNVKLTVWDPSGDRVYSAMMYDEQNNYFEYRVRSIFDEASNSDADVDVEMTV
jgi:hypothetical protein